MKRFLIMFLVLGLMISSIVTADAREKKKPRRVERTVVGSYGPYPAPVTGCSSVWGPFACVFVSANQTERFFTAKVTDVHGQPVFVEVGLNSNHNFARFCGETKKPIRIKPGDSLEFYVGLPVTWASWIQTDCPAHSIKTTGTISVTLSNRP